MIRRARRLALTVSAAAIAAVAVAAPAPAAPVPGPSSTVDTSVDAAITATAAATESLRARLGGAYGNSWLDGSGRLTVGVTDPARAAEARGLGAVAVPVRHGAAELDALVSTLDRRAASAPASVTGWYVDAPANRVVVQVLHGDAAGTRWAAAADSPALRVERATEAPRTRWQIIGGQPLTFSGGPGRCSVGFNARDAHSRYVLTAGHCTNLGGIAGGVGGVIGPVVDSSFPGNDYGVIEVTNPDAESTPYVGSSGTAITGSRPSAIGARVCRIGSTTGLRCGTVLALNQTVNYGGGNIVSGLTRTNVCSEPGDSGGPFFSGTQAQGLTSGGSGNCTSGGTTFYQPINEALAFYGLTLHTG